MTAQMLSSLGEWGLESPFSGESTAEFRKTSEN